MVAGANSINDMDLLRRGGTGWLFSASGRPSTLGRAAPVIAATRLRRVPDFVGYGYEPGDTPRSARVTVLSTEYPENVAGVLLGVAWDRSDGGGTE